jgi:hypothetical protein
LSVDEELCNLIAEIGDLVESGTEDFGDRSRVEVEEFGAHRALVAALGVFEEESAVDGLVGGQVVEVEFA